MYFICSLYKDFPDVHQLTAFLLHSQGLQQIRCPQGLSFDLEKQACDWKDYVSNCDQTSRVVKAKPLLVTDEPICTVAGELACGDASCIKKELFCDGIEQCSDGSDENACGKSPCQRHFWNVIVIL